MIFKKAWWYLTAPTVGVLLSCAPTPPVPAPVPVLEAPAKVEAPPSALARSYEADAKRIIDAALASSEGMRKIEHLCDDIGPRMLGSQGLEQAIAWTQAAALADGLDNVHAEVVPDLPAYERGLESLRMEAPREAALPILGLVGSPGTAPEGLHAEALVVGDEAELQRRSAEAVGKIVVFNFPMKPYDKSRGTGYGETAYYRGRGPAIAAQHGAVACLVRSVTARSLATPHTGGTFFRPDEKRIPAAAITLEDADSLARLQARGIPIKLHLTLSEMQHGTAPSANVIAELRGRERPEEVVVLSGHLDSWDVGQGALDDAAGCVMALEAAATLKRLQLIPRRTVRVILFTGEEIGSPGAEHYAKVHSPELKDMVAAIEADLGAGAPQGYSLYHSEAAVLDAAVGQMEALRSLFAPLEATAVTRSYTGADIHAFREYGVVELGHLLEPSTYFDYHHSKADTVDKVDPGLLAKNIATMAVAAYVIADMPDRLGGQRSAPSSQP